MNGKVVISYFYKNTKVITNNDLCAKYLTINSVLNSRGSVSGWDWPPTVSEGWGTAGILDRLLS